ncbi:MAG: fatty acid desaturase [Vicinamibacterales bacterium]
MDLDRVRTGIRVARRELPNDPTRRFALAYGLTVAPLLLAAVVAVTLDPLWGLIALGLVAGFVQNGLGILTHEASHYFMHRDRIWNDRLANALVCLPVLNTVEGYRREHLMHHRDCCGPTDPYYDLYGPYDRRRQLVAGFIRDLTGVTALTAFLRRYGQPRAGAGPGRLAAFAVVQLLIAAGAYAVTGYWWAYGVVWLAPLATVPFAVNRIRTFVEHHATRGGAEAMRTTRPTWFEYLTIAPYGYAHHFEHHVMPDVPYYQLAWAHDELGRRGFAFGPEQQAPAGYLRTFARQFAELR